MERLIFKVVLYSLLMLFTVYFVTKKNRFVENRDKIEKVFFVLMVFEQIVRHITYVAMGKYTWLLPFHICNISGLLACYWLYTKNQKVQAPLFFLSFMAIAALVVPRVNYSWRSPLYYTFIIDHIVLSFIPFYMITAYNYFPKFKELLITLVSISGLLFIGHMLNGPFHENYFYLKDRPLLPHIPFPIYMLSYILLLFTCFSFIRFVAVKRVKRKQLKLDSINK